MTFCSPYFLYITRSIVTGSQSLKCGKNYIGVCFVFVFVFQHMAQIKIFTDDPGPLISLDCFSTRSTRRRGVGEGGDLCHSFPILSSVTRCTSLTRSTKKNTFKNKSVNRQASPQFYLKKLLCLLGCFIILCSSLEIILIFSAVHVFMDRFARQTVWFSTHRTVESVYIILIHTPPLTVRGFTVEAVWSLAFRCGEAAV